ncbi:TolB family protein [Fredinandcohnia humi]
MEILSFINIPILSGYIAYTSTRGGQYDIWLYHLQNGSKQQLTNGLGDAFSQPVWSGDNSKLAFVGRNQIVYIIYLSTGRIAAIDQIDPGRNLTLDWSPDHTHISYATRNQIMIYNVVTHRSYGITEPDAANVQWFPSGRELLFQGIDGAGIHQLYRISVNGTGKTQITNNTEGALNNVRLSPDGTFVLYTTPGVSISLIRTIDLTTGNMYEIEGGGQGKNYYPTWSPNSQSIGFSATAFSEETGYFNEIRTVGKRGENERVIATSTCFATPLTWSPDGRKIAYLSGCKEQEFAKEMWVVLIDGSSAIFITRENLIAALEWSAPFRPNGTRKRYRNQAYRVSFYYPFIWTQVDPERYEGSDGFFQISAISGGDNIEEICRGEAFHQLMPYGSAPRIQRTRIQNQEACFIFPSADQPQEMRRQSALIVRYPSPVQINGATYNYFILWADENHIREIASTLVFI